MLQLQIYHIRLYIRGMFMYVYICSRGDSFIRVEHPLIRLG